jgi:hypothetical protein
MQPKTRVELTGANGGPVSVDDTPSMIVLARRVALAFRLAAQGAEAGLIEDAGGGTS